MERTPMGSMTVLCLLETKLASSRNQSQYRGCQNFLHHSVQTSQLWRLHLGHPHAPHMIKTTVEAYPGKNLEWDHFEVDYWTGTTWNVEPFTGWDHTVKSGTSFTVVPLEVEPMEFIQWSPLLSGLESDTPELPTQDGIQHTRWSCFTNRFTSAQKVDQSVTRKAMPGITSSHLQPNNFEKMRVSYAFQLFGPKVLQALNLYKPELEMTWGSILGTQIFFKRIQELIPAI
ncbi:uncharacterized protein LOC135389994 isoform X2 [Ornithodoros turicata]|uniref:uncharacterized protein LOC135389994 isoform X2 n=1 Tax=Ornithodoros turicata TaxID=34597 RepID=UPI0031394BE4